MPFSEDIPDSTFFFNITMGQTKVICKLEDTGSIMRCSDFFLSPLGPYVQHQSHFFEA